MNYMPVVPIKELEEKTPDCVAIVGQVTQVYKPEMKQRGKKLQALQKFTVKDESGSVAVSLYGNPAAEASLLFHGDKHPLIRLVNFDVKKNTSGKETYRLFSLWDWKPQKTQIYEVKGQVNGALVQSVNPILGIKDYQDTHSTDVLGVLSATWPTKPTANKLSTIREIDLHDASGAKVRLTLWEPHAVDFTHPKGTLVSIRGAKVKKYLGGTTLSVSSNATIQINPKTKEANNLKAWDQEKPPEFQFVNISETATTPTSSLTIEQIYAEKDPPEKRKIELIVQVSLIHGSEIEFSHHFYESCPKKNCNKKVTEFDGKYRCDKCAIWYSSFKRMMKLPVDLAYNNTGFPTSIFQKYIEPIIPLSCNSLYSLSQTDPDLYKSILEKYLRNKDFNATIIIKKGTNRLDWHIQQFTEVVSSPTNVVDIISNENTPTQNENDVDEEADAHNPHLGLIDEIDAIPDSWREENSAKK